MATAPRKRRSAEQTPPAPSADHRLQYNRPEFGPTPLLQVYGMPASVHFYLDLLGFPAQAHSPLLNNGSFHWAQLRRGEAELTLNTAYEFDNARPGPARVLAHGDICLYLGCPDVDAVYAELKAKGLPVAPPSLAPDGYGLCFRWPIAR